MKMVELKILKESAVRELYEAVPQKLSVYRNGSFDVLLSDSSLFLNTPCALDPQGIEGLKNNLSSSDEVKSCLAIANGLDGVTPYLARDERLWTRLTHFDFFEYSRARWPIPDDDDKAIIHIRKHFFARDSRGIERDNAISRLWWMSELCKRVQNLSLKEALTAFLYQSDVRASIIERPTTSQNPNVLSVVINKLHESYLGDKSLFEREKFRALMKQLNIQGGVRLLEALNPADIEGVIDEVAKDMS